MALSGTMESVTLAIAVSMNCPRYLHAIVPPET